MREMGNCVWAGEYMLQSRYKHSWSFVAVTLSTNFRDASAYKRLLSPFFTFFTASIHFFLFYYISVLVHVFTCRVQLICIDLPPGERQHDYLYK